MTFDTAEQETPELEVTQEPEGETASETLADAAPASADDEEVVVSIGEAPPPPEEEKEKAPEWVRELRKKNREDSKRIKELEERLKVTQAENKPAVAKKPVFEDFDFDTDKYDAAMAEWFEQDRRIKETERAAKEVEAKADAEWRAKLDAYAKAKAKLEMKFPRYQDSEAEVMEQLDPTQQGILLDMPDTAEVSALIVAALGDAPEVLKRMAALKSPVKFTRALSKLEDALKVTKKTAPPPPETKVVGSSRTAGTVDSTLDRLRDEAAKTGDYTKINRYKQQLRARANK